MNRMVVALIGAVLLTFTLVTGGVATASTHAVDATSAKSAASTYNKQAFAATNKQRVKHDRRQFKASTCLQKYAQRHANRMAKAHKMFHQTKRQLKAMQKECGPQGYAGENVAYGYPGGKAVVNAWMHSKGHRANILFRKFNRMGLAAAKSRGTWYVAQEFGHVG